MLIGHLIRRWSFVRLSQPKPWRDEPQITTNQSINLFGSNAEDLNPHVYLSYLCLGFFTVWAVHRSNADVPVRPSHNLTPAARTLDSGFKSLYPMRLLAVILTLHELQMFFLTLAADVVVLLSGDSDFCLVLAQTLNRKTNNMNYFFYWTNVISKCFTIVQLL